MANPISRTEALSLIKTAFSEKLSDWAEAQLLRAENNLDGEVEDYADLLAGEFGIEA